MMRWFLQIAAMLSDLVLFAIVAMMLWRTSFHPVIVLLVVFAIKAWYDVGNLEAWRPSTIRTFLKNAKGLGL